MSAENVDLVRAGFDAFREGGPEALTALIAPDFELTTPPSLASEPDTYRGPEGLRRYFDSFYDAMDEIGLEPRSFHEAGERVVVEFTLRARGRTSQIEAAIDGVMVWELHDGLARRVDMYPTLDEALSAARAGE